MEKIHKLYSRFRKEQSNNFLRQKEIPIEHYVSLPLPAITQERPAYIYFACPVQKIFDESGNYIKSIYGSADRSWLLSAESGALLKYEFGGVTSGASISVGHSTSSISELKELQSQADTLLDELSPAFFNGSLGYEDDKKALYAVLQALIPEQLLTVYKSTAVSFLEWLQK